MLLDAFMYQPHITNAVCYPQVNIYEAKTLHGLRIDGTAVL